MIGTFHAPPFQLYCCAVQLSYCYCVGSFFVSVPREGVESPQLGDHQWQLYKKTWSNSYRDSTDLASNFNEYG